MGWNHTRYCRKNIPKERQLQLRKDILIQMLSRSSNHPAPRQCPFDDPPANMSAFPTQSLLSGGKMPSTYHRLLTSLGDRSEAPAVTRPQPLSPFRTLANGPKLRLEDPAVGEGQLAAGLVIVWVVDRVIAISLPTGPFRLRVTVFLMRWPIIYDPTYRNVESVFRFTVEFGSCYVADNY